MYLLKSCAKVSAGNGRDGGTLVCGRKTEEIQGGKRSKEMNAGCINCSLEVILEMCTGVHVTPYERKQD